MPQYDKHKPETIQTMFGSIAKNYDRTNAILSFQLHRLWNPKLMQATIQKNPLTKSSVLADLCCGTGAISLPWLKSQKTSHQAFLVDFCAEMLACAEEKAKNLNLDQAHSLNYINADVQSLPLQTGSVDFATMAYGIRNVKSPAKCFQEVYRILKNNGSFGILELTEPENFFLRQGHRLYLKTGLPLLGKLFAKNYEAYKYLSQSIQAFVKPEELKLLLEQTGFSSIQIRPLSFGIATLVIAQKSKAAED
jgi:demethylmenaquinone methyltransferase / 2-methoxy-6-polyprenyl-1,4-benzoquinol methylase